MTPARGSGAAVRVLDERTIEKRQSAAATALEAERTRLGAAVADASGRFAVPELLASDPAQGRLLFARWPDLQRLDDPATPAAAFARAGAALAAIHASPVGAGQLARSQLAPSPGDNDAAECAPPPTAGAEQPVFAHGDFGLDNVLWSPQQDRLVVLDWADAVWVPQRCRSHRRPASVDLAIFLVGLGYRSPLRAGLSRAQAAHATQAFLAAYREAGGKIDAGALRLRLEQFAAIKHRGRRTWLGRLLHQPALRRLGTLPLG